LFSWVPRIFNLIFGTEMKNGKYFLGSHSVINSEFLTSEEIRVSPFSSFIQKYNCINQQFTKNRYSKVCHFHFLEAIYEISYFQNINFMRSGTLKLII
jgi:hypothetical protein